MNTGITKTRKTYFILFLLLVVTSFACVRKAGRSEAVTPDDTIQIQIAEASAYHVPDSMLPDMDKKMMSILRLEIPKTEPGDFIISHTGFSLLYNEDHEQACWVAYELTREKAAKVYDRTDKFIPDPRVTTLTANNKDYSRTGFDRGHLAPASDMGWSAEAMAESFYYSNISPQVPGFNRGIWKKLEERVRTWAVENEVIHIVTGPVLTSGLKTIGANNVSVPEYYYKVVLDYHEPGIKGIGFIIPNAKLNQPLHHFAVSIDSVENFTGIDFFPALPDDQEDIIEKTICIPCWSWGNGVMVAAEEVSDATVGE
jgi:endonuclease G, mitochondrial